MPEVKRELDLLREQISILETFQGTKFEVKNRDRELKRYHQYLEKTKAVKRESIEPTELLRKMRAKGAFY